MVSKEDITGEIDQRLLSRLKMENNVYKVNAGGVYYRDLNVLLKSLSNNGAEKTEVHNVYGQRYIGTGLENMEIEIYGTPGNDLGAFMNGSRLVVYGNVQDGCGNTMNEGEIIVHGRAGDIAGYSMRGGKIFIRDDVGYRVGIHMKEYREKKPYLIVGGTAQDFLGEYMAGGILVVLGLSLKDGEYHKARFVGTGMHGGIIYVRGKIEHLGKEVELAEVEEHDMSIIENLVKEFCNYFGFEVDKIMQKKFTKIAPVSHRPYGKLYAY